MYRNTYVEVNTSHLEKNVRKIIAANPNYQYYFGVVKANCYGHGIDCISALLRGGINYLAVATLQEALEIREKKIQTPILILGYVPLEYLSLCRQNELTITVPSLEYAKKITDKKVLCHIKINTGMNRLGISSKEEYEKTYELLKDQVEGVYTHIYKASDKTSLEQQVDRFEEMIEHTKDIPIIHIRASEATVHSPKREFENGCRLGIVMYNLIENPYSLEDTFSLVSEIVQIQELKKGDTLGYDGAYMALKDTKIGVVPIGYADGILRKNEGRDVYIHGKRYPIVGHICMDMLFVEIDDTIQLHDSVEIIKDSNHIIEIANYLETIPYEVICNVGIRVPRMEK